jgi:hypothetical protein
MKHLLLAPVLVCLTGCFVPCIDDVGDEVADCNAVCQFDESSRIRIPATVGPATLPFAVDLSGAGTDFVGAFTITDNFGEVALGERSLPVLIVERSDWIAAGWVLYQGLAVASDAWCVLWFYCSDGQVEWVYYTGTDETMLEVEAATGTCSYESNSTDTLVDFPETDMPLPDPLTGYTISGPNVRLDDSGLGCVFLDDGSGLVLLAFEEVDCRDCPGGPWYEVQSLLWDPAEERACFVILYLFPLRLVPWDPWCGWSTTVLVSRSICLPDLTEPVEAESFPLRATWTVPAKPPTARPRAVPVRLCWPPGDGE